MKDRFGFLPCDWIFDFDGGTISPIPEIYKVRKRVEKYTNEDGFLYPPLSHRVQLEPRTNKILRKIPGTERPAHLHRVPPSHELRLRVSGTTEELRKGPGAFVIHLLAYLFGMRLQFHDWWFDSRVPIRMGQTHNIHPNKATAEDFLSHCYRVWQGWLPNEQKLITNVLFMHSRAPSYEWDWERFAIEYMVLDGCWKLAELRYGITGKNHSQRIRRLCQRFGIPYDKKHVKKLITLRNNLFHETLWDGSQPCTAVSPEVVLQPHNLRQLNQRLIPALFGYKNAYVNSIWWSRGAHLFDKQ